MDISKTKRAHIVRVKCLGKSLGIAKGLRFSVLQDGVCIGNILKVTNIVDNDTSVELYSELLKLPMEKKFRISDLVEDIDNGKIKIK